MANADELLAKKKFKKLKKRSEETNNMEKIEQQEQKFFNYRPWNYMEEMDRQGAIKIVENNSDTTPTQPRHNSDTNLLQSNYKPTTNLLQSGSKVVAETGSKVVAKWEQTSNNSNTTRTQLPHNSHTTPTQPPHNCHTTPTQLPHNCHTNPHTIATQLPHRNISVEMLSGHSKTIILYLYKQCKINRKCDVFVSSESIVTSTNIVIGSISTTLKRLKESGYIEILQIKSGAGAWRVIRLNDSIYKEILANELSHNCHTTPTQLPHNCHTHPHTNPPLVASSNITTTANTNSYTGPVDNLPPEWQAINYEAIKAIGFGNSQIAQLYKANLLSAKLVQESIDNFAFTLLNYPKAKEYMSPVSVLMSVLTKGNLWEKRGAPQAPAVPLNAPPEQVEEAKQQAIEREKTEELFHREYCKWYDSLSNEELKQLFPAYDLSKFRYGSVEVEAEELFRKTKWVEIYNEICAKTSEVK